MSDRNRSLDALNGNDLLGSLTANKTNLLVELEPGSFTPNRGEYIDLRQEPLAGTEGAAPAKGDIHVTGTVVDADTGKPLENFTNMEGRDRGFQHDIQWFPTRQTEGTNGRFEMFLNKGPVGAAVAVSAEVTSAPGVGTDGRRGNQSNLRPETQLRPVRRHSQALRFARPQTAVYILPTCVTVYMSRTRK